MSERPGDGASADGAGVVAPGWYAYTPLGAQRHTADDLEDPVREVYLVQDEHSGPFHSDDGVLGDNYNDLHKLLGISRALVDDAVAWNQEGQPPPGTPRAQWERDHYARQQDLYRRLAEEVHPGIRVPAPRTEPPTVVSLGRLKAGPDESQLLLWDEAAAESGEARALPPTPSALNRRVVAWVVEGSQYEHGTLENSSAVFAWENEGVAIARDLGTALGEDYIVKARW